MAYATNIAQVCPLNPRVYPKEPVDARTNYYESAINRHATRKTTLMLVYDQNVSGLGGTKDFAVVSPYACSPGTQN